MGAGFTGGGHGKTKEPFMDWNKTVFIAGLCVMTFALAPPLYRLSRAVEGLVKEMGRDCVVGIPEKPGNEYRLEWVKVNNKQREKK